MGVYELSAAGSLKTSRIMYPSMNANNGNSYGALVPIANYTATSSYGRYFIFSSIPQTYKHLRLVLTVRSDLGAATDLFGMFLNSGEGGTINSETYLEGNGATQVSLREANLFTMIRSSIVANSSTSGIFSSVVIDIPHYGSTTAFKTVLARTSTDLNGSGTTTRTVSLARITSAINTINVGVIGSGTNLVAGSTAVLYGIRAETT